MLGSIISTYKIIDRSEVWTKKIIKLHTVFSYNESYMFFSNEKMPYTVKKS